MKRIMSLPIAVLTLLFVCALLQGCGELIVLDPKGPIGDSERTLILVSFGLMLVVVIPVIFMSLYFPLKYRASNTKARYEPNWSYSKRIEIAMWLIPLAIVAVLSVLVWTETKRLDPYLPLAPSDKQLPIEVVSLDWKWLFIYPEQNIAVVNEMYFPAKEPLSFSLTSDTVMTSFFIPQLGSQIYAMAGMKTKLHLLADEPGVYAGQNQQISGDGFSTMTFKAVAVTPMEFEAWVGKVKNAPEKLDFARFEELKKPSAAVLPTYFSSVEPGLFEGVIMQFHHPREMPSMIAGEGADKAAHAGRANEPRHRAPKP